jgi:hypothetical protein
MWNEWPFVTGNVHPIDVRYKHFWLAIVIVRPLSLFAFVDYHSRV